MAFVSSFSRSTWTILLVGVVVFLSLSLFPTPILATKESKKLLSSLPPKEDSAIAFPSPFPAPEPAPKDSVDDNIPVCADTEPGNQTMSTEEDAVVDDFKRVVHCGPYVTKPCGCYVLTTFDCYGSGAGYDKLCSCYGPQCNFACLKYGSCSARSVAYFCYDVAWCRCYLTLS